jgi:NAD(P)-dependent dehydrogenase (short-subunit alcohol dehydrogenase family)
MRGVRGMKLGGKIAVVTGTSPNIGGGLAEALAAEGARVACVDSSPANAEDCAAGIRKQGGEAVAVVVDITSEGAVAMMVDTVTRELGPIDLLVNNAVIFNQKGVLDMPLAEWQRQLAVILDGAFLCTQAVAQRMVSRGQGGAIVNIISTAGHQGQPNNVGYCTAKSGLLNFTRSVAMELAAHGIRVNSLTPTATDPREGMARAERWGRPRPADRMIEVFEPFRRSVPTHVLPSPSDYGRALVYLASDDARHVTGTDLRIDSGAVARYWAWDPAKEKS